jgi:hypothetical protein
MKKGRASTGVVFVHRLECVNSVLRRMGGFYREVRTSCQAMVTL